MSAIDNRDFLTLPVIRWEEMSFQTVHVLTHGFKTVRVGDLVNATMLGLFGVINYDHNFYVITTIYRL